MPRSKLLEWFDFYLVNAESILIAVGNRSLSYTVAKMHHNHVTTWATAETPLGRLAPRQLYSMCDGANKFPRPSEARVDFRQLFLTLAQPSLLIRV
jgi:hypothetical protein